MVTIKGNWTNFVFSLVFLLLLDPVLGIQDGKKLRIYYLGSGINIPDRQQEERESLQMNVNVQVVKSGPG